MEDKTQVKMALNELNEGDEVTLTWTCISTGNEVVHDAEAVNVIESEFNEGQVAQVQFRVEGFEKESDDGEKLFQVASLGGLAKFVWTHHRWTGNSKYRVTHVEQH